MLNVESSALLTLIEDLSYIVCHDRSTLAANVHPIGSWSSKISLSITYSESCKESLEAVCWPATVNRRSWWLSPVLCHSIIQGPREPANRFKTANISWWGFQWLWPLPSHEPIHRIYIYHGWLDISRSTGSQCRYVHRCSEVYLNWYVGISEQLPFQSSRKSSLVSTCEYWCASRLVSSRLTIEHYL